MFLLQLFVKMVGIHVFFIIIGSSSFVSHFKWNLRKEGRTGPTRGNMRIQMFPFYFQHLQEATHLQASFPA